MMIPLAAGVLFPSTRWQMPPWVAGARPSHRLLVPTEKAAFLAREAGRAFLFLRALISAAELHQRCD